LRTGGQV